MLDFLKSLFGFKAKPAEVAPSAPYKVPEPAATTKIPLVVETAPIVQPAKAKATKPKVPAKPKAPAKAKAPAAPKAKAPAKPKAPKAPKAKPTTEA
jgi:hypothetical protein